MTAHLPIEQFAKPALLTHFIEEEIRNHELLAAGYMASAVEYREEAADWARLPPGTPAEKAERNRNVRKLQADATRAERIATTRLAIAATLRNAMAAQAGG